MVNKRTKGVTGKSGIEIYNCAKTERPEDVAAGTIKPALSLPKG